MKVGFNWHTPFNEKVFFARLILTVSAARRHKVYRTV
jgi:hypothetical protein